MIRWLLLICLSLSVCACASKQVYKAETSFARNVSTGPSITGQIVWLKHKSDTIDILMRFANDYPSYVQIQGEQATLAFSGQKVKAKHIFTEVAAGLSYDQVLVFDFHNDIAESGLAALEITPVRSETGEKLPPIRINIPIEKR